MKAAKFLFVLGVVLVFGSMITCALMATWGVKIEELGGRIAATGVFTGFLVMLTSAITAMYSKREW